MSWDCDTCGRGNGDDHSSCRIANSISNLTDEMQGIKENLEKLIEILEKKVLPQPKKEC